MDGGMGTEVIGIMDGVFTFLYVYMKPLAVSVELTADGF
jgi:hypothetical protein